MVDDLGYMLEEFWYSFGSVVSLLVYGAILYFGGRWLWKRFRRGGIVGGEELMPTGDPMRYALASAVLKGSLYRRRIIDTARNPFIADAPELGLEVPTLVAAAKRIEETEKRWQWLFLFLITFFFLGAPLLGWLIFSLPIDFDWDTERSVRSVLGLLAQLSLIAVIVLAIYKQWRARFRDVQPFRREEYSLEQTRGQFGAAGGLEAGFDPVRSNAVVFGTSYPFVGFGKPIQVWQVVADLARPSQKGGQVDPVTSHQAYDAIERAVRGLGLPGVEISDIAFVNGTESTQLPEIQNDRFQTPVHKVPDQVVRQWRSDPDSTARVYRWIRVPTSHGEIRQSYFVRCVVRGQTLFLESVQTFLPPVARTYREVDFIRRLGFFGLVVWLMRAIVMAPVVAALNLVGVFGQVSEFLSNLMGGPIARERREIRLNPAYNYGARETVRERIMSSDYAIYFQRAEGAQFNKALDQQVLNAVSDLLEEAGVDTTVFGRQATVIQESTVNISSNSGGSVVIGGSSNVGGFVSRLAGGRSSGASSADKSGS